MQPTASPTLLRAVHVRIRDHRGWQRELCATLWQQGFLLQLNWRIVPALNGAVDRKRREQLAHVPLLEETFLSREVADARLDELLSTSGVSLLRQFDYSRPAELDDGTLAAGMRAGAPPPHGLALAELVRQLYPNPDAAKPALTHFLADAPFTWGYWAGWKWLYKQAEATRDVEMLAVAMRRLDRTPDWVGRDIDPVDPILTHYPSARTMRYLKRRMRRYRMRLLAEAPDIASRLWQDILIGYSTSEELELEGMQALLTTDSQIDVPDDELPRLLDHGVIALAPRAASLLQASLVSGTSADAFLLGAVFPHAERELRTQIVRYVEAAATRDPALGVRYLIAITSRHWRTLPDDVRALIDTIVGILPADRLLTHAGTFWRTGHPALLEAIRERLPVVPQELAKWVAAAHAAGSKDLAEIQREATERFRAATLSDAEVAQMASVIVTLGDRELVARTVAATALRESTLISALLALPGQPAALAEALAQALARHSPTDPVLCDTAEARLAMALLWSDESAVSELVWDWLAADPSRSERHSSLLQRIVDDLDKLRVALAKPAFVMWLVGDQARREQLAQAFEERRGVVWKLKPAVRATLLVMLPASALMQLLRWPSDWKWHGIEPELAAAIAAHDPSRFWVEIWIAAAAEKRPARRALHRLASSATISATFLNAADAHFLDLPCPLELQPLLARWLTQRPEQFIADPHAVVRRLHTAAPVLGDIARTYILAHGLPPAQIVELLSSADAANARLGQQLLDAAAAGSADERDLATRLVSYPSADLHTLGYTFVRDRAATLAAAELVSQLAASADQAAHALALDLLGRLPATPPGLDDLLVDALTTRWATAAQRTTLRRRLEADPASHTSALLALARRGAPVHQAWALRLLTGLALGGATVEGLEVVGVAGV